MHLSFGLENGIMVLVVLLIVLFFLKDRWARWYYKYYVTTGYGRGSAEIWIYDAERHKNCGSSTYTYGLTYRRFRNYETALQYAKKITKDNQVFVFVPGKPSITNLQNVTNPEITG